MTYTGTPTRFEIYTDDDLQEFAAKIEMQDEAASTIKIRTCVNPDNWPGLSDAILAALLQMHPQVVKP
jgi:NAD(P)H-flavin reductase